ncbi:MAG TPA: anti-sigma factor, partial [Anaerolineales bacterium]|nr:anti-sigma factor [Anaerolineales bacterium]
RVRFDDFNFYMDKIAVTLNNNISQPEEGTHYEVWLRGGDPKTTRDIGAISYNAAGVGRLDFNNPSQDNFLRDYDQVLITREKNGVAIAAPTNDVAYSSVFPPQALKYVRYVIVSYDKTPDQGPLMQNLWYYSGDYVNKSINGDDLNKQYQGIVQAFTASNEATLRKRTEEVINQIVGNQSNEYLDYDGDGIVDDPGDGYGSISTGGEHLGYLQETILYAKSAADAPDSTPNIRLYSENVQVCIQNMEGWSNEILQLALQLSKMPMDAAMQPVVTQLSTLGNQLVHGIDTNGNGFIDPSAGECGADTAYEHAYFMADMPVYTGSDRIPPSGK